MKVKIDDTIYIVLTMRHSCKNPPEVCVLQTFDYADGTKRQQKIWTSNYEVIE